MKFPSMCRLIINADRPLVGMVIQMHWGCRYAASVIWISYPPIWFTMILYILHYIAFYPVQFGPSPSQDGKNSATLAYIQFASFLRTTSQSFFSYYILCGFEGTYLFVHRTMLHRISREEYPSHYPQGPKNKL